MIWLCSPLVLLAFGQVEKSPVPFPVKLHVREVKLASRDICYDVATQRIYASVGSNPSEQANSIVSLDPVSGSIGTAVYVGSEPSRMAIPPEGGHLYVVLEGAKAICRFNTRTRTAEPPFPTTTIHIADMLTPANRPDLVIISKSRVDDGGASLFIRGKEIRTYDWGPQQFFSVPDGNHLYGLDNSRGGSGISKQEIGPTGWGAYKPILSVEENSNDIKYEAGKLYANSGRIYDFVNPSLLGTCGSGGRLVAPSAKENRVFYLEPVKQGYRFHAYDTRTFTSQGWMPLTELKGNPTRLVKWGENSYAIRTDSSQILLISPVADLFTTAREGKIATLRELLERRASPDQQDNEGKTPLLHAAAAGQTTACEVLLQKGVNVHLRDFEDNSPIMVAAERGHLPVLNLLLRAGAKVNDLRSDRATPLLLAAQSGHEKLVQRLLDKGAFINARSQQNRTILMRSVLAGQEKIVRLLIAQGADVKMRADNNETALQLATQEGYQEIVALLKKAGAQK
jgi:uncharacterized protein